MGITERAGSSVNLHRGQRPTQMALLLGKCAEKRGDGDLTPAARILRGEGIKKEQAAPAQEQNSLAMGS